MKPSLYITQPMYSNMLLNQLKFSITKIFFYGQNTTTRKKLQWKQNERLSLRMPITKVSEKSL